MTIGDIVLVILFLIFLGMITNGLRSMLNKSSDSTFDGICQFFTLIAGIIIIALIIAFSIEYGLPYLIKLLNYKLF